MPKRWNLIWAQSFCQQKNPNACWPQSNEWSEFTSVRVASMFKVNHDITLPGRCFSHLALTRSVCSCTEWLALQTWSTLLSTWAVCYAETHPMSRLCEKKTKKTRAINFVFGAQKDRQMNWTTFNTHENTHTSYFSSYFYCRVVHPFFLSIYDHFAEISQESWNHSVIKCLIS